MNTGAGIQFNGEGPVMSGTWFNPQTGHRFTVRDCFFQDGQFMVQTTDGQMLDYNTVQNYVQANDQNGKPIEPPTMKQNSSTQIPKEVAEMVGVDENYMIPEDQHISKGLGNINDSNRHFGPGTIHTIDPNPTTRVTDPDTEMIDRVLKRFDLPRIEASIAWETPVKQIETLVDVLGIDPVKIADYYCDKLDMPAIIANIRTQLSLYIKHIVDTSTIESVKQDIPVAAETETPRPKTKKTKK